MQKFLQQAKGWLAAIALGSSFSAAAAPAFTVNPVDGAEVETLSAITITYTGASDVTIANASEITFMNYETGAMPEFSVNPPLRRPEITIQFSEPVSTPGTYGLFIPSGAFLVDGAENGEIDYVYTVTGETPDPGPGPEPTPEPVDPYKVMSVTPAPGVVTSVSEWTVNFDCDWAFEDRNAKFSITCSNPDVVIPKLRSNSNSVRFADDVVLTAPGTYTLTIPAGRYLLGPEGVEVPNPEMVFEYVIESGETPEDPGKKLYDGSVLLDPEEGTYSEIVDFSLFFDGPVTVADASKIRLLAASQSDEIPVQPMASENMIYIMIDNSTGGLFTPDTYYLSIEEGALNIDGKINPSLEYRYLIGKAGWAGEYTADPADDSTVESLSKIVVTFVGANAVVLNPEATPSDFPYVLNGATGAVMTKCRATAKGNALTIRPYQEITAPGAYAVMIPATFITVDGENPGEDLLLGYYIEGEVVVPDFSYEINPANGSEITLDQSFTIRFAAEGLASVGNNTFAWGNKAPHFTSSTGGYCPSISISRVDDVTFTLSHTWPFKDAGEYQLVIPEGYFTLAFENGATAENQEITADYKIATSGIVDITADSRITGDVYNTVGALVLKGATAEQVKALSAGLYIVGGVKVLVK